MAGVTRHVCRCTKGSTCRVLGDLSWKRVSNRRASPTSTTALFSKPDDSDDCCKQINNGSGIESDQFNYTSETAALSLVGRNVDFVRVIVGISQCAVAFQRHVRSEPPWPTLLRASLGCGSGPCGGTCQKRTGKQECSVGNAE